MGAATLPALRREADPVAVSFRGGSLAVQRAALAVSSPQDAAEREASSVARQVVQMRAPSRMATASPVLARSALRVHPQLQRAPDPAHTAPADTAARIQARQAGGAALPAPLRSYMEPRFGADFSAVRVHTDEEAGRLAQRLGARAFTTGGHIFFGRGQFQPGTAEGRELVAHELAHTVQQGAAPQVVQREVDPAADMRPPVRLQVREPGLVQRLGLSDILDGLAALAANVPGYTLLTLIIGRNPINLRAVERNVANVLRAFIGLIPGGEILFQVLQRYGVVDRLGQWVHTQTAALGLNFQTVREAFTRFTDSLGFSDIFSPGDVWRRAQAIFTPLISRVTGFVSSLVTQAVTWLKATFMEPLSGFCRAIPGYGLVTVMLGRDPFTDAPVPRTALTVVRGFAELIPGGTEKVNELIESGALQRAHAWFQQETAARNLTWARVTGTFASAWATLQLSDVLAPVATLQRMVGLFRPLFTDLVSFAGTALVKLLELIYEAAMGAGGRRILDILMRARSTFLVIIRNPVGFLRNLLGAVAQGVRQFMTNILSHLQAGVIAWLTGPVARAGIQMPERWDLRGVIWFVLQILGLTWANVRGKLVRLIGEPAMAMLERGFALITDIRDRGLVVALRERVTEFFGSLRDSALGAIRSFIQQRLVMAGITQLLSLLNPAGAIIQAILKTYTTIQFFIQRINQILDFVESIVNSIAAIASGAIGAAANFVERTMARTIPIMLDFLARFIGLGDVGAQVQTTIRNLQTAVDGMLNRAVDWVRNQARNLASRALGGDPGLPSADRVRNALSEAVPIVNRYAGRPVGAVLLRPLLLPVKLRHRLSRLDVVPQGAVWGVLAAASPEVVQPTTAQVDGAGIAGQQSRIRYTSGTLAGTGNTVGTEMVADPLGPDHPEGQEPSGANIWASLLVTDPGQSNDSKYIRGHLLNHQVGGTGAAQNLFPITAAANDLHESVMESHVKRWVNTERKWVYYRVHIAVATLDVQPRRLPANNKVDADIVCEAYVIEMAGSPPSRRAVNRRQATIASRFRARAGVTDSSAPARERAVAARPADLAATVALPAGHEYILSGALYDAIRSARARRVSPAAMQGAMQTVADVGPAIAQTVLEAYRLSRSRGLDIGSVLATHERSNLTQANRQAAALVAAISAL